MKIAIEKGVLEVLTKLAAEGVLTGEVEEKNKVVQITANQDSGEVLFETVSNVMTVSAKTMDAKVEEGGKVQVDFAKFAQLVEQVNVAATITSTESECRVVSGSAVWRLKVKKYDLPTVPVAPKEGEVIRTETLKDILLRTKVVIPTDADATLDSVRMCALAGQVAYATDRARVVKVDFAPAVSKAISLSRAMVESLLRFIAITAEPDFRMVEEADTYVFSFRQSVIRARKLAAQFPVSQLEGLFAQETKPWFDVRREDLVDGLKKAVVTSEYGEPKVSFKSIAGEPVLEMSSEDIVGNRGQVTIPANVTEPHEAAIRAELIRALIESSKGERVRVSLREGRFIRMDSEGVTCVLMTVVPSKQVKPKGKTKGK